MEIKSFYQNSLITFFTQVFILILGFLTSIIIARTLGPEGKGIYSLTLVIPGILTTLSGFGIESANVYFVGSKKYKVQDVVSTSFVLAILIGFVAILLFWGISHFGFFQEFIKTNRILPSLLWIIVIITPFYLLLNFLRNIIRGEGNIKKYNILVVSQNIIEIIALIIFLLILKQGVSGAIFSYAITIIGIAILTIFFIKRSTKITLFINKKLIQESFIYGGKVYLSSNLSYLNHQLSLLLVGIFLSPFALGIYSIGLGLGEKLFLIPRSFATVLFPKISSSDSFEANELTPKVARHTFFIIIVSSLLLGIFSAPLITIILGQGFLPSVTPLIILLPGIVALSLGGVLITDLNGRGKPQFAFYSSLVRLITSLILITIFTPRWGVSGAALATTIAYWLDTLIILIIFAKICKRPLSEILLIKREDFRDYLQMFSDFQNWIRIRSNKYK